MAATKDAEPATRPRRSGPWLFRVAAAVGALVVVIAALWLSHQHHVFQQQLTAYGDVRIGDTRDEVLYKRGGPPIVYGDLQPAGWMHVYYTDRKADPANAMPEGTSIEHYGRWGYSGSSGQEHFDVIFDKKSGRVNRIECVDRSDKAAGYCPPLFGIRVGDTEVRVNQLLGAPTRHGGVRTVEYEDLGVVLRLEMQRVYGVSLQGVGGEKDVPFSRYLWWVVG